MILKKKQLKEANEKPLEASRSNKTVSKPDSRFEQERESHEVAVSKEMSRMQDRLGPEKKPFGSIKLPSFDELQKKKPPVIGSDDDDDW